MPTRFMKLVQIVQGGVAIGMGQDDALRLAVLSPGLHAPLRLAILDDIAEHPVSTPPKSDGGSTNHRPPSTVGSALTSSV